MAHKDYVSRGRSAKKKPPPPKFSLPWLRIVITLALLAGFISFLWSIKDKAQELPAQATSDNVGEAETLPDIPQEEWEFIKSLPEYTVEIDVQDEHISDKRYLMQCGSFRAASQAQEMKANIAFQGLEAQVRPSDGKSGRWHRVILGPYDSKRLAETHRHSLQKININTCVIWNWNL